MVLYKYAQTDEELNEILQLQQQNLPNSLSKEERELEGFVTVQHTFDVLKKMNETCAHIIAKDGDKVIGYALCMHPDFGNSIEVLKAMFQEIDAFLKTSEAQNSEKTNRDYIVMGQICIDKQFRRQGIFRNLYELMQKQVLPTYSRIITEVDAANKRSLDAHYAVGFKKMKTYKSNGQIWELIELT